MRDISELDKRAFDVIVIGGGITGAFAAWDAALRGLKVALLEGDDFGGATSAHSLKFAHGGIRYLQHLDIPRLRESCRERSALLRIAPHLVSPMPVVVPCYGHGMAGTEAFRAALLVLRLLTWDRNRGIPDPARHIPGGRILSVAECRERYPDMYRPELTGAAEFCDGHIYNPTRLVYAIMASARATGATTMNYCEVTRLQTESNRVTGVVARDRVTDAEIRIGGRVVLNCAGPFAEQLLVRASTGHRRSVPLSRDMAVVIPRRLVGDRALAVQTRYRDPDAVLTRGNRHLFMVPWRDYTLIGVNSRMFEDDPYSVDVTEAEVQGFVDEINEARPSLGLNLSDVTVVNYGLLPFGENAEGAANLSFGKRSPLMDHGARGGPEGLITAMSVRLTMGRTIAEDAVDLALQKLGIRSTGARTQTTPVAGGDIGNFQEFVGALRGRLPGALSAAHADALARNHGTGVSRVLDLIREQPGLGVPLPDSTVLEAEVIKAVRDEQVVHLSDVVLRRTDLGTGECPSPSALQRCAELVGNELKWDSVRRQSELASVLEYYPGWARVRFARDARAGNRAAS